MRGGAHLRDHLYFIDLSISAIVHGWEAGEQSPSAWPVRLLMLGLYHRPPYLFSPPPFQYTSRGLIEVHFGAFGIIINEMPLGIPDSSLI